MFQIENLALRLLLGIEAFLKLYPEPCFAYYVVAIKTRLGST